MRDKLARYGIVVWVVANLLDLALTVYFVEASNLAFEQVEVNPISKLFPYPSGFILYKLTITAVVSFILYLIGRKYKSLPMWLGGSFILVWLGGTVIAYSLGL